MGLIDLVQASTNDGSTAQRRTLFGDNHQPTPYSDDVSRELLAKLKHRAQDRLLQNIDISKLESAGYDALFGEISSAVNSLIHEDNLRLTDADRARLIEVTTNEMVGLGPLEPLLQDNSISDILVNGYSQVWIERGGRLYKTDIRFNDERHLMSIINRIVSRVGRRIDESSPMVDARLPDGSRVNAVVPPLAIDGAGLSIRRFGAHSFTMDTLIRSGTLTSSMAEFMRLAILCRLNVLVSGGTGSGKTTLLNCLSSYIPEDQRIITIEDAAELALQQPHVFRLETRPPNVEGKGEITQRELFRNTLRMRPDRIIVGEVRGAEVLDMLQAMSTGHDGSLATIHANNPRDSLGRLEMMMLLSGIALPEKAMRQYIANALNIIIHLARLSDGSRKVIKISELTGMEGETVLTQDLYEFVQTGIGPKGKVIGAFRATGTHSIYGEKMKAAGFKPDGLFLQN